MVTPYTFITRAVRFNFKTGENVMKEVKTQEVVWGLVNKESGKVEATASSRSEARKAKTDLQKVVAYSIRGY